MQSVGEAMAISRTFASALQKAMRSMETGRAGLNADQGEASYVDLPDADLSSILATPAPMRIYAVAEALRRGYDVETVAATTMFDPWFVDEIAGLVELRLDLEGSAPDPIACRSQV